MEEYYGPNGFCRTGIALQYKVDGKTVDGVDGILGGKTTAAMERFIRGESPGQVSTSSSGGLNLTSEERTIIETVLHSGNKVGTDMVRQAQDIASKKGYGDLLGKSGIDGSFGGKTRSALSEVMGDFYTNTISDAANKHDVPPSVLKGLLKQESQFDRYAVSPAGAKGIAQIMPGTAKELGIDPMNPEQSIEGAAKYLREQYDRLSEAATDDDRWRLSLASYNAGRGNINDAMREYAAKEGLAPNLGKETSLKGIAGQIPARPVLYEHLPNVTSDRSTETQGYVENIYGTAGERGGYAAEYEKDFNYQYFRIE
ncbi:MAG: transglycosylase SLT domain-containing protein [Gammaproteobacteria bacterium]|nr:transglycosylase SLT domain-containing protein [Gammaproteobacteria bacterium]